MFKLIVFCGIFGIVMSQQYNQYSGQPGRIIGIKKQYQDIRPDGSYEWEYETENGIAAQEQGKLRGSGQDQSLEAQGQFSYTSPEGQRISLAYVADDTGFHPSGDLPTPPPIPAAILRSIQWNYEHPEEKSETAPRPAGNRFFG